jgi:hypothetical protein
MKFLINLELDGYEDEKSHEKACRAFIEEQLDFSGSSVKILGTGKFFTEAQLDAAIRESKFPTIY